MKGVKVSAVERAPKNISVFLRVRPPMGREIQQQHTYDNLTVHPDGDKTKVTIQKKSDKSSTAKCYTFNKVWDQSSSQKEVYEECARSAVEAAFDGLHGVLFVYGQTGSGKTFTISNEDQQSLGVLQQSMLEVWSRVLKDKDNDYVCSVSYVQLYNELLTDLLDVNKQRVRLQTGTEGRGDVVMVSEDTGLGVERTVTNYMETMDFFREGMSRKEMNSTDMNKTSSRSHTIFTFYIHKSARIKAVTASKDEQGSIVPSIAYEGRLVLCDLAGSERLSKTNAADKQVNEAVHINGSLLVLGKVVAALIDKKSQHAPFRESKLTRLLQYSLLGNGNTSIVINISPSDDNTDETHSAIQFGQRAIQIKQEAKRHEVLDYKALYLQLQADLETKQDNTLQEAINEERRVFEERIAQLKEELRLAESQNELLRRENEELRSTSGASPSTPSTAKKDPSPPRGCADSAKYTAMIEDLRAAVKSRDKNLEETNGQRLQLGKIVAAEQLKCFKLAQQLQALTIKYNRDIGAMSTKIDEVNSELARLRGTDFLSVGGAVSDDSSSVTNGPRTPRTIPTSPSSAHARGDSIDGNVSESFSADQVGKAYEVINTLRQERTDLMIYQKMSEKAIKLLHAEKENYRQRLSQLLQQASPASPVSSS